MLIKTYRTNHDFIIGTATHSPWIRSAYQRGNFLANFMDRLVIIDFDSLKTSLLNSVPVLGTLRGLASIYSTWAVKEREYESVLQLTMHTLIGIVEALGLGLLLTLCKIIITALCIITLYSLSLLGLC